MVTLECCIDSMYVVLQNWQAELPSIKYSYVNSDKMEYHHATIDSKGYIYKKVRTNFMCYIVKQIPPVNHQIFNKWERLDQNVHCGLS